MEGLETVVGLVRMSDSKLLKYSSKKYHFIVVTLLGFLISIWVIPVAMVMGISSHTETAIVIAVSSPWLAGYPSTQIQENITYEVLGAPPHSTVVSCTYYHVGSTLKVPVAEPVNLPFPYSWANNPNRQIWGSGWTEYQYGC